MKYLYKYIFKGHDHVMTSVQPTRTENAVTGAPQEEQQHTNEPVYYLDSTNAERLSNTNINTTLTS
ncbi:hypothetical protein PHYBLDRAFT_138752 [Phycomyces blakesleeanus NRRL 1555(-)]|uniref:Uncharacterized protein n=1 Tax=Phycomyces blakesleeanus (strain ATCC 8743b / DSM 1359 / FGSC 10004 / NBRC 33097 / NRRL 1555) TaxID=763407 RepID=A0A167RA81_PHYB8|nr:hypothetical protein PHYBLDRAFT_138752 [Phycomyces blakesleeanus NRRL 1555(-)]OAD81208.1 hypothetical protein PHYBLDRAFT_138752 [Phycomyces blakesleeanus NRRL 1555(-)]|eukprot:XP_018299248.1 hypothetical protein PHYBLDRAFT_138752 [Phycomyces blakesleeanus NRRL 1555(-)]